MSSAFTTFTAREPGPTPAIAALVDAGFEFDPPRPVARTLLDSFDGRIHAAGLRLEARELPRVEPSVELIVSGAGVVAAQVRVDSTPRGAGDLPPGPFRSRLAAIIDVRALLPLVRLTETSRHGVLRDQADKVVALANVHTDVRIEGRDDVFDGITSMIEIETVAGYSKGAASARDALVQIGLVRFDGDAFDVVVEAAQIDLAGFSGSPTVPLDPTMPAADGFRAVLANLADTIAANWQGTVDQVDPEFLHDLRVAVRRTRTVIAQGKRVLPPATVELARGPFAWLGSVTGPARDLDVYLLEWDRYISALRPTALEPVRAVLEQRREAAYSKMTEALQSAEAAEWMSTWRGLLRAPTGEVGRGVHADRPLGNVVAKRVARAQANLVERGRLIRADTPADVIHDLRKDAKKLRYLLECFASMLPNGPRKAFVRRLKALQDNLGEHQDAEVHVAELRAISRELREHGGSPGATVDTWIAIGQLSERLEQLRLAARAEFAERFATYDTKATRRALDAAIEPLTR